jgi:hypothetical protein
VVAEVKQRSKTLLAPTNPQWARVVGYGPFSLYVIYKVGLDDDDDEAKTVVTITATVLARSNIKPCFRRMGIKF